MKKYCLASYFYDIAVILYAILLLVLFIALPLECKPMSTSPYNGSRTLFAKGAMDNDNFEQIGDKYEFFYFSADGWKSLGVKVAEDPKLIYDNASSYTL